MAKCPWVQSSVPTPQKSALTIVNQEINSQGHTHENGQNSRLIIPSVSEDGVK